MRFTKTIASASVAAVLGLGGVSVAGAVSTPSSSKPAPAASATQKPTVKKGAATALRRRIRRAAGLLVAKTIGIKPADLRQELLAGKTIAAIATEHGVQPQKVIDTLVDAANAKIAAGRLRAQDHGRARRQVEGPDRQGDPEVRQRLAPEGRRQARWLGRQINSSTGPGRGPRRTAFGDRLAIVGRSADGASLAVERSRCCGCSGSPPGRNRGARNQRPRSAGPCP